LALLRRAVIVFADIIRHPDSQYSGFIRLSLTSL